MAENPPSQLPGSSDQPSSNEQSAGASPSIAEPISQMRPGPSGSNRKLEQFAEIKMYRKYEPYAKIIKIALQMLIGLILVILLLVKASIDALNALGYPVLVSLVNPNPLSIVAYGLFFSSGVELAFMLFTPGPDEAVDPLMMGLAAAILLDVSYINYNHVQEGATLFLAVAVLALAGLFAIKKFLHSAEEDED